MRYFISQPMNGLSDEEILQKRMRIVQELKRRDENAEIIDSFFENVPHDANPLWYLGEALKLMSTADYVFFADGFENSRGCKIEYKCAKDYSIPVMRESFVFNKSCE